MSKLFFYDLETTGLSSNAHGIHQLAGMIVIDNKIRQRFNFKIRPFEGAKIEESALNLSGVTKEQIEAYPPAQQVFPELINLLSTYVDKFNKADKFHLVGYRIDSFDNEFLRKLFMQNGDQFFGSWFWSDSIDLFSLSSFVLQEERASMENFKLFSVAEQLGIPVDKGKLHDAEYDVFLTVQIYYKILHGTKGDLNNDRA